MFKDSPEEEKDRKSFRKVLLVVFVLFDISVAYMIAVLFVAYYAGASYLSSCPGGYKPQALDHAMPYAFVLDWNKAAQMVNATCQEYGIQIRDAELNNLPLNTG